MKTLILIVGRTNSGKDTLTKIISNKYNIPMIVSYTDRPIRKNETNGIEHIFLSEKQMTHLLNSQEILAYTKIENPKTHQKGYRYCVTKKYVDDLNSDYVFYIIDPNGIAYLKEKFKDKYHLVTISIMSSETKRKERSIERGDTGFEARCKNENTQFNLFENNLHNYDYQINNDNSLELSVEKFNEIIKKITRNI